MTGSVGARWRATGSPEEAGEGVRVRHQAAEIPVTPQQEIFDEQGRFIARADLRIDGTRRIHEYDGARHREADVHEVDLERDRALLGEHWERHGFTSKHLRRDGATIIADADRLLGRAGIRVGWLRGRARSTTRSSDGPVAPAPTATGGEPTPKPVRCNRETGRLKSSGQDNAGLGGWAE